jgi:hypothetical protein
MKKILFAATFTLFASTQAFAILGAGAHYVMNTGSLRASNGVAYSDPTFGNIMVDQGKADGLKGIGFKAWLDVLPFVDLEGTFNISASRYKTSLIVPDPINGTRTISLSYAPDAPYNMLFDKADPVYGIVSGDLSVTYPFDVLPIVRPYVGVGFSYFISIPIVDAAFTKKVMDNSPDLVTALATDPLTAVDGIGGAVIQTLKDSDYNKGMGGHILVGVRAKAPVIPIAIYLNTKYYFGGDLGPFTQGISLELGGGFAL